MKKFSNTSTLVTLLASLAIGMWALAGCSGSGRSVARAEWCIDNYNPMKVDDNNRFNNKLSLKPEDPLPTEIKAQDYAYQGSEIYYHDVENEIRIHLRDTKLADGSHKTEVVCSGGNITPKTRISYEIPIIKDILIKDEPSGEKSSQIRTLKFSLEFGPSPGKSWLRKNVKFIESEYVDGSIQNFYPSTNFSKVSPFFMTLKEKNPRYQLISHLEEDVADSKSGKLSTLDVRTLVTLKYVTPEERKDIDKKEEAAEAKRIEDEAKKTQR